MRTLRNLTLHVQGEAERTLASRQGFDLTAAAEGTLVDAGEQGLSIAAEKLAARLRLCASRQEAALVGGHTGVWLAAILLLTQQDAPIPDLLYFDTRRVQDSSGHFVFVPEGLVCLHRQ
jgi:hypothetical protein